MEATPRPDTPDEGAGTAFEEDAGGATAGAPARESDLYAPVRDFLAAAGFAVRGEVGRCDVVGVRDDTMIVVELKRAFGLAVLHQALDRQAVADLVYVAVAEPATDAGRRAWRRQRARTVRLCRMLGLGLLTVRGSVVTAHADPGPYQPRRRPAERRRLLREFQARSGDHNQGGRARAPVVTAYREDALRIAALLARAGALKVAEIRRRSGVSRAGPLLQRNVYGWFDRTGRGVYALTPAGGAALVRYEAVVKGHAGEG